VAKLALAALYGNTNRTRMPSRSTRKLINKPTASVSKVTAQLQLAETYQTSNQPLMPNAFTSRSRKTIPARKRDNWRHRSWRN